MPNKYRPDVDLNFLKKCKSADLGPLFIYLTTKKGGRARGTEEITATDEYKEHYPDHHKYWELIAAEFQHYAGNTFANITRGHGVLYKEALMDVCDKIKVNYNEDSKVELIEMDLLIKILTDSVEKMSPRELKELIKNLDLKTTGVTKQAVILGLQVAIKLKGFAAYKITAIVASAVAKAVLGKSLAFGAYAGMSKGIAVFAGPIGLTAVGLWTLGSIAGVAYRVTIPCVIQIAFLRAQSKLKMARAKKAVPKKTTAKKAATVKRQPDEAFMRPLTPSKALAAIVGAAALPRTEVVKKLWAYIKKNNLQDAKNRRNINADDKLKPIFGKAQVSMYEMTKIISKHLK